MILKGSQRAGGRQLAAHLLNDIENDHVTVHELRGFMAVDLANALDEAYFISKATKCQKYLFSLSLNPPKDGNCDIDDFLAAANMAEAALGLDGQPRAIVFHEKQGRRHGHAVWSRIDAKNLKALPMSFFKTKLSALSKDLYLEHGWELPKGHRENDWKSALSFDLAEWQQCKRLGLDPRELKLLMMDAWKHSVDRTGFAVALEARGYSLARGDRRGFVVVDVQGEVHSLTRLLGLTIKDIAARIGPPGSLENVAHTQDSIRGRFSTQMRKNLRELREQQAKATAPVRAERSAAVKAQRAERGALADLQAMRWSEETRVRQGKTRRGIRGLWDVLTGRAATIRRENEQDTEQCRQRDERERESMIAAQMQQRAEWQAKLDTLHQQHRQERMQLAARISMLMALDEIDKRPTPTPEHKLTLMNLEP